VNFYKHYLGDYARDTQSLSLMEHGAYRVLLDHCYATEKPLPTGAELYRVAKAMNAAERKAVDRIAERFFPDGHNARCDKELANAHAYADAQAKRSHMRWHKQAQSPADASHSHSQTPEKEKKKVNGSARARAIPLPEGFKISERVKAWADSKGLTDLEPDLEFFVGRMKANGKTYLDWDEAFMNCVREDWAGLRKAAR